MKVSKVNDVGNAKGKRDSRAYHHGGLRKALIEAGRQILETSGGDNLSLREVARQVQVSPTAIYRHFPDKAALLSALAEDGLERLGQAQALAAASTGFGQEGFVASGRAYVRFALAFPALFRLILSFTPKADLFASPEVATPMPMRLLRTYVQSLAPVGLAPADIQATALRAWSQVHGLAMLMLDQQVPSDEATILTVIDGSGLWPGTLIPTPPQNVRASDDDT